MKCIGNVSRGQDPTLSDLNAPLYYQNTAKALPEFGIIDRPDQRPSLFILLPDPAQSSQMCRDTKDDAQILVS